MAAEKEAGDIPDTYLGEGTYGRVVRKGEAAWKSPAGYSEIVAIAAERLVLHRVGKHPNIRGATKEPRPPPHTALVLEYIPLTLEEVRFGKSTSKCVRAVAVGLLKALTHAHAAGVCHGDVRMSNVLVRCWPPRTCDDVLLMDWGSARLGRGPYRGTRVGMDGAPPEVILGTGLPGDVWGVGIIALALTRGRIPGNIDFWHCDGGSYRVLSRLFATSVLDEIRGEESECPVWISRLLTEDPTARPTAPQALALMECEVPHTPPAKPFGFDPATPLPELLEGPWKGRGTRDALVLLAERLCESPSSEASLSLGGVYMLTEDDPSDPEAAKDVWTAGEALLELIPPA
jgi:serine/threonine protein kinase